MGGWCRMMDSAVAAAVAEAHRAEWGFVLAATLRITRDVDAAEECVQEAYAQAMTAWTEAGIPARPAAWLTLVARRRAMDLVRRADTLRAKLPLLLPDETAPGPAAAASGEEIGDDRLRLIFTCCHPTLPPEARVALTLRLLCGLSTAEVARAFLVSEPTMAARITRAKKKITAARIPYRVPPVDELPKRVDAVLDVVHLLFTTGHTAPTGDSLQRRELAERARDLAQMLHRLLPGDGGAAGLLALILLTDARRDTRTAADGRLLRLAEQDRARWDRASVNQGLGLVRQALACRPPSRYALMAAIGAVHAKAPNWPDTDWAEIAGLYQVLVTIWPSPVVALNRAVAIGEAHGPAAGLAALDELSTEPRLAGYHYLAAARAEFLQRLGRAAEARLAYQEAILLAGNNVERDFLTGQLRDLGPHPDPNG